MRSKTTQKLVSIEYHRNMILINRMCQGLCEGLKLSLQLPKYKYDFLEWFNNLGDGPDTFCLDLINESEFSQEDILKYFSDAGIAYMLTTTEKRFFDSVWKEIE